MYTSKHDVFKSPISKKSIYIYLITFKTNSHSKNIYLVFIQIYLHSKFSPVLSIGDSVIFLSGVGGDRRPVSGGVGVGVGVGSGGGGGGGAPICTTDVGASTSPSSSSSLSSEVDGGTHAAAHRLPFSSRTPP